MPLPPAPTKRAALLSKDALDTPVRPLARPASKPEQVARSAKDTAGSERPKQELQTEPLPARTEKRSPSPVKTLAVHSAAPAPAGKARKPKSSGPKKLFVLDTNVLMHDPMCLFRFEEHDIFLPMIVLEELDGHKKGMTEVARNARQTSRTLDALAGARVGGREDLVVRVAARADRPVDGRQVDA